MLELMLVVAIIGVMGLIAVPKIQESVRNNRLRGEVRRMTNAVAQARVSSLTQQELAPDQRSQSAGLEILDGFNYRVYLSDRPDAAADASALELDVRRFQLPQTLGLQILTPPGRIRFRRNGVLDTTAPDNITNVTLRDGLTNRFFRFAINATGNVRLE